MHMGDVSGCAPCIHCSTHVFSLPFTQFFFFFLQAAAASKKKKKKAKKGGAQQAASSTPKAGAEATASGEEEPLAEDETSDAEGAAEGREEDEVSGQGRSAAQAEGYQRMMDDLNLDPSATDSRTGETGAASPGALSGAESDDEGASQMAANFAR